VPLREDLSQARTDELDCRMWELRLPDPCKRLVVSLLVFVVFALTGMATESDFTPIFLYSIGAIIAAISGFCALWSP
jgi:hypothetical protein